MSDLISRSALMESLIHCDGLGRKSLEAVIKTINEQPTACDVDKVVEGLEDLIQRCCYCRESCNEKCLIERIIEIVRGGGVNEIKN